MPDDAGIETEQFDEGTRSVEREETTPAPEPINAREPAPEDDHDDDAEADKPAAKVDEQDEDAKASEAGKELAKRKRGLEGRKETIQQQINALVRERGEVTRETERGRQERAELQREIEALRGQRERVARGEPESQDPADPRRFDPRRAERQPQAADDPRDPRPLELDYEDYAAYTEAIGRWGARQEVRRAERARSQREEMSARQRWEYERQTKYSERYKEFAKANPTFEDEINREDLVLTATMMDTIKDSPVGPAITLFLARNPEHIDRITRLHPVVAYGEMKKIEARLEGAHSGSPPPAAQQHSKAPAPIKPVDDAVSRGSDGDDVPDENVSDDEHFERMNKRDEMLKKRGVNIRKGYGVRR